MPQSEIEFTKAASDKAGEKLEKQFKPNKLGRLITIAAGFGAPASLCGFISHIGSPEGELWFWGELVSLGILIGAIFASVHKKSSQESISNETGKSQLAAYQEYKKRKDDRS